MAESKLPECAICRDPLLDPRALPCGHSFCGPRRNCIQSMELSKNQGIRCSMCTETHKIKASDLKPLYGIRELFEEQRTAAAEDKAYRPPDCELHGEKIEFWCKDCEEKICCDCLEDRHDGHSVCAYLKFLKVKVKDLMEKWEKDKIRSVRAKNLNKKLTEINSKISVLEADKLEIIGEKAQLQHLNEKWEHLDSFVKSRSLSFDMDSVERFLKYSGSIFGSDNEIVLTERNQAVGNNRRLVASSSVNRDQARSSRSSSVSRDSFNYPVFPDTEDDQESDDTQPDVSIFFKNVELKLKEDSVFWSKQYEIGGAMFRIGLSSSANNKLVVTIEAHPTLATAKIQVQMTMQVKPRWNIPVMKVTIGRQFHEHEKELGYDCAKLGALNLLDKYGRLWITVKRVERRRVGVGSSVSSVV